MYFNQDKTKSLLKNRIRFPEDLSGTQSWASILCSGAQIWPPWRHAKTKNRSVFKNFYVKIGYMHQTKLLAVLLVIHVLKIYGNIYGDLSLSKLIAMNTAV